MSEDQPNQCRLDQSWFEPSCAPVALPGGATQLAVNPFI
jgi:hypothetical protein